MSKTAQVRPEAGDGRVTVARWQKKDLPTLLPTGLQYWAILPR